MDRATAKLVTEAALLAVPARPLRWHEVTGTVVEIRALLDAKEIQRHKTAISRKDFSVPVKALIKRNLIKGNTIFDYGCGRGDDIRLLDKQGHNVGGWDPYWAPKNKKTKADIVTLSFVLNVIEDPEERTETLGKAFKLAKKMLVVSTRPPMKHSFKPYSDGFVTSTNTFQKFWKSAELKSYLQKSLGVEPVSAGSCVYMCFRSDKIKDQMIG